MPKKLTKNPEYEASEATKLTIIEKNKFIICFSMKLEDGYNFKKMQPRDNKELQNFLDKVSDMDIDTVDRMYKRKRYETDYKKIGDVKLEVEHYKVGKSFRIHGVYANGMFHVLRLDVNHKFQPR